MVSAAAKATDFACGIQSVQDVSGRGQHTPLQIRMQTAQTFAREDIQPHGYQRSVFGVEDRVGFRRPDQFVTAICPRAPYSRDLRVLGKGIGQLGVSC